MEKSLSISLLLLVFLSGCASHGEDQILETPEEIITTPDKKRITCVKFEHLPKCDGYYVLQYSNYLRKCISRASCMRSGGRSY